MKTIKMMSLLAFLSFAVQSQAQAKEEFNVFYIYNSVLSIDKKTEIFTPIVSVNVKMTDWKVRDAIHNQFRTYFLDYVKNKMKLKEFANGTMGRGEVWERSVQLHREETLDFIKKYQKDKKILFVGNDFDFKFDPTKK